MKIRHLLVIREGEESQEDSLKIKSVGKFLEALLWILRCFLLDFCFSCESELSKCLNSQTWQTGWIAKIMCGRWNFNQKLKKKWACLHKMRFSCRIIKKHVSIYFEIYFMIFRWKCVFAIRVNELVLWSSMKEKFWYFVGKWFELIKQVQVDDKFKFSYLEKFSHSKNLDGMENLEKTQDKSSYLSKISSKLSLLGSSHSLQR